VAKLKRRARARQGDREFAKDIQITCGWPVCEQGLPYGPINEEARSIQKGEERVALLPAVKGPRGGARPRLKLRAGTPARIWAVSSRYSSGF